MISIICFKTYLFHYIVDIFILKLLSMRTYFTLPITVDNWWRRREWNQSECECQCRRIESCRIRWTHLYIMRRWKRKGANISVHQYRRTLAVCVSFASSIAITVNDLPIHFYARVYERTALWTKLRSSCDENTSIPLCLYSNSVLWCIYRLPQWNCLQQQVLRIPNTRIQRLAYGLPISATQWHLNTHNIAHTL